MTARDIVMSAAGASAPVATDPNFENVTLLLNGDGTNGAQNNTFLDSSTNNFTITRNGNTTQGTFSPYGNLWSNYFDGSGDYLTSSGIALGTGNVTVELWFFATDASSTYRALYDGRGATGSNTGLGVFQYGSTIEVYGFGFKGGSASNAFSANQWVHCAVVRTSGTCQIYINGVASGSSFPYSDNFTSTTRKIGSNAANGEPYIGYISNIREVTSALYSGSFTPSNYPLTAVSGTSLLTCQSNRFKDNSSNNFTLTVNGNTSVQRFSPFNPTAAYSAATIGGSGYFDGSGDYLSTSSANFSTTGDFTLEAWGFVSSASSYQGIVSLMSATAPNNGASINILNTGQFRFAIGGDIYGSSVVPLNQWFHVALVRSGSSTNNCSCYLNGTRVGQFTSTAQASGASNALTVGKYFADGSVQYLINGCIANTRYVVGSALYSGTTYTVPTAPLAAVSGTQLLLNFTNAGIQDISMQNNLETIGNAQVSTSVKKYGTGSLYFDGTGDYAISKSALPLGSGDFTVEFWVYVAAYVDGDTPISIGTYGTWYPNIMIRMNPNWTLSVGNGSSWVFVDQGFGTKAIGSWAHIAIVRSSGTIKAFLNGIQGYSVSNTTNMTNTNMIVGVGPLYNLYFNGYIDDLRITKGYARYPTEPFPTAALPTY